MDIMNVRSMALLIDGSILLLCAIIWIGMVMFLRMKKQKSVWYLLCFTLFYIYVFTVLDYTQFQFQSLLVLNYLMPGALMLRGGTAGESMNLLPLITLTPGDIKTSLLNILMTIPFGFGLPCITTLRLKGVVIAGVLFSVGLELLQLLTGLIGGITFRIVDINDVIFNTLGAAIGYILFSGCIVMVHRLFDAENPIMRYMARRQQGNKRIE